MREIEIERYLSKQVKQQLKGLCLKFVSPGFNGVPDRIILLCGGRVIFVETKAPGKKMRKLQEWVSKKFNQLGFKVLLIDTKEKVNAFVKEVQTDGI